MHIYEKVGMLYELSLANRLSHIADLHVLSNVALYSYALKRSSPVDAVVVYGNTVFIVEAKSSTSILEGTMNNRSWYITTRGGKKSIFNPVLQAREKLRAIQNRCRLYNSDVSDLVWRSIVIVPDRCTVYTDSSDVMKESDFVDMILNIGKPKLRSLQVISKIII